LKKKKYLKTFLLAAGVLAAAAGILCFPTAAADGARNGLRFCGEILIPSIFPFMVLSAFVVKSGLAVRISAVMEPVTKRLFHLPGCTGATIILGLIGGYPSGARGIKALIERGDITPRQGERMLSFAVGAGPAFVISVVGSGLLGSGTAGILLFASQIIAAILIGILTGHLYPEKSSRRLTRKDTPAESDISSALVQSSADSVTGMLNMSAFVILFSSMLTIIKQSGVSDWITNTLVTIGVPQSTASSLLSILLEVTGGCTEAARVGASPVLISFALGWAGACVHFQISASLSGIQFSRLHFTFFRFLHGVLAAGISYALLWMFPQSVEALSNIGEPLHAGFAADAAGSIMLILVCAAFLITLFPGPRFQKNSTKDRTKSAVVSLKR
jgi:sporulation integral membrane protein YlbJ